MRGFRSFFSPKNGTKLDLVALFDAISLSELLDPHNMHQNMRRSEGLDGYQPVGLVCFRLHGREFPAIFSEIRRNSAIFRRFSAIFSDFL
jgi:hypothetical protein